ncbi:MAG: disulfide reductase, partial [Deltaproteobacteria bacterium]|nr:disulfide reductase [Deltaproteobacteria bacterium]
MKVTYYPGCSLKGTARDYAESVEGVCSLLDIELCELDDWNCCGATAAHSIHHRAAIHLPGRNLAMAQKRGLDMVVPCPLCFNRLKTAEKELSGERKGQYDIELSGEKIAIQDLANFLSQETILDRIEARIDKDLTGLKCVCYYGCMASRPPGVTGEEQYENPMSMDRIVERLGVEV